MAKKKSESEYFINSLNGVHGKNIATPVGRCAFLTLTSPGKQFSPDSKPKYGLQILFDKQSDAVKKQLKEIQAQCLEIAEVYTKNLWSKEGERVPYAQYKKDIFARFASQPIFRDGDASKFESHHGCWYIVAKNEKITDVVFLKSRMPEEFESGMLVQAEVIPYVDKQGFSYKLKAIHLVKDDGKRFNAAPRGGSVLEAIVEAEEAVKSDVGLGEAFDAAIGKTATEASSLDVL